MNPEQMKKLCFDQRELYKRTLINKIANPYFSHDLYDIFTNQIRRANGILRNINRSCGSRTDIPDIEGQEERED